MNVEALQGALQCERFGLPGLASALSCDWLVRSLAELGAFAEGMTYGDEAVRIAEAADHAFTLIAAYHSVGLLCLRKGEIPKALAFLEHALTLVKSRNVPYLFGMTASCLGSAYALAGQVELALPLLEQVLQRLASGVNWMWGAELSEAYLLAGQRDELLRLVGRALECSPDLKERGHQAWLLRLLGEITARRDPPEAEQTQRYYQQALALADARGMRPLQAHCHRGLGMLYAKTGQREQARAALATAVNLYRTMEMILWLPETEAALAQVIAP
jgi:tetratricopeptide (TPR) repeat protein